MPRRRFDITPYRNVLLFAIAMVAADVVWKLLIHGEERLGGTVLLAGLDVTGFFDAQCKWIAGTVYSIISLFDQSIRLVHDVILRYDNGNSTSVVWSCTPVKQMFIYTCIMLATPPYRSWHKLWFVGAGWIVLYGVNILRIAIVAAVIKNHPDWFEVTHTYVLKYAFYGILFALWLLWVSLMQKK